MPRYKETLTAKVARLEAAATKAHIEHCEARRELTELRDREASFVDLAQEKVQKQIDDLEDKIVDLEIQLFDQEELKAEIARLIGVLGMTEWEWFTSRERSRGEYLAPQLQLFNP